MQQNLCLSRLLFLSEPLTLFRKTLEGKGKSINSTSKMISERTFVIGLPGNLQMSFRKCLYFEMKSKKA